jgi:uridine kinase
MTTPLDLVVDVPVTLESIMQANQIEGYCAKVNGRLKELSAVISGKQLITFLDLHHDEAMRIYETSLRYLIAYASYLIDPHVQITFNYSISRSIYLDIENLNMSLETFYEKLSETLRTVISNNHKIKRITLSKEEAKTYYDQLDLSYKTNLFDVRKETHINAYQIEHYINYLYGYMIPSSGYIKDYHLFIYRNGLMLQYPRAEYGAKIPTFKEDTIYKNTLKHVANWAKIIEGDTIDKVNRYAKNKADAVSLIQMSESKHSAMLYELAEDISMRYARLKLIGIAGPSSSGKTTFARRLQIELQARGLYPVAVSIDDYYLHPDEVPKNEDGTPNLEHIEALDLKQFNLDILSLIEGKVVTLPHFDFKTKTRKSGKTLQLKLNEVILIEGIHALNQRLTETIDRALKYFIYIAPQTQLHIDKQTPIRVSDMRLLRRIVRDAVYRDTSAEKTMEMWSSVRQGEFKWIYDHQQHADYTFNSELAYELAVLKKHALHRLEQIELDSPYYMKANYLMKFLKYFADIEDDLVPNHSLIREFIGGSVFE